MTHTELQQIIDRWGMTQVAFSRLMGVSDRSGRDWFAGRARIPHAVAVLVRLIEKRPELRDVVGEISESVHAKAK